MNWLKEQIANFFTLMNLVCGVAAIFSGDLKTASLLIFAGALFDFADGFVARALKITSDIGKQLDSLSDLVTFGVVPGLIANQLLAGHGYGFIAILIPAFSAIRLAKFNIDTRQSKDFIGMPTPANALFWAACGIIISQEFPVLGIGGGIAEHFNVSIRQLFLNPAFVISCIVVTSLMLVSPLHIMGIKFDRFAWKGNEIKFSLVIISVVLILFFGITGIPIIIVLYPLLSMFNRTAKKT